MLAAYRVLLAAILLFPLYLIHRNRHGAEPLRVIWRRSWFPGIVLGAHFISWVIGARLTPGANSNLIVNLMPIVMPFLMFTMFRERVRNREILATAIAIAGMFLLGISDFSINRDHLTGDAICLLSMLLFALYLALARVNKAVPSIWLYIVPVYLVAGVSTFLVALLFSSPIHHYTVYNATMIFALASLSTVIGHSALNYAMQRVRGQTVTVVNMGQFIVGGLFAYLVYQEVPAPAFYVASGLLLVAMWLVLTHPKGN